MCLQVFKRMPDGDEVVVAAVGLNLHLSAAAGI
jgi:hypothetical protein